MGLAHVSIWLFLPVFDVELCDTVAKAQRGASATAVATLDHPLGTSLRLAPARRRLLPLVLSLIHI